MFVFFNYRYERSFVGLSDERTKKKSSDVGILHHMNFLPSFCVLIDFKAEPGMACG